MDAANIETVSYNQNTCGRTLRLVVSPSLEGLARQQRTAFPYALKPPGELQHAPGVTGRPAEVEGGFAWDGD